MTIIGCVAIQSIEHKRVLLQICCLFHLSVCLSRRCCGKMADCIRMAFRVV